MLWDNWIWCVYWERFSKGLNWDAGSLSVVLYKALLRFLSCIVKYA